MTPLKAISCGYTPLHSSLAHSGYAIFIHENALNFLNKAIKDDYLSFELIKKIISMRSNPRPRDGNVKKTSTDHRQLTINNVWVSYFIVSGIVYIDKIDANVNSPKEGYNNLLSKLTPLLYGVNSLPSLISLPALNLTIKPFKASVNFDTKVIPASSRKMKNMICRFV